MAAMISSRAGEAARRPGRKPGVYAGQRIRKLTILSDVVEWLKEGHGPAEVARRIQANGFLEEVPFDLLRKEVGHYAKVALDPAEVLEHHRLSSVQRNAVAVVENALRELMELGDLYRIQKAIFCEATGMRPSPGTIGAEEGPAAQVAQPAPVVDGLEAELPKYEASVQVGMRPKTFRDVRELLAEMRHTIRIHGSLRERLGGLAASPEERQASLEDRLGGVIKGRFAGRLDVQEVLLDPRRRTKILGVLHQFLTSERTQDAAKASLAEDEELE